MLKTIILTIAGLVFALVPLFELPILSSIIWIPVALTALYLLLKNHARCMQEDGADSAFMYGASGMFVLANCFATFAMPGFGYNPGGMG